MLGQCMELAWWLCARWSRVGGVGGELLSPPIDHGEHDGALSFVKFWVAVGDLCKIKQITGIKKYWSIQDKF